jgi:hypothetical protein
MEAVESPTKSNDERKAAEILQNLSVPPDLPSDWIRVWSKTHQAFYYFCKTTQHSQFHFPSAYDIENPEAAKLAADEKALLEKGMPNLEDADHQGDTEEKSPSKNVTSSDSNLSPSSESMCSKSEKDKSLGTLKTRSAMFHWM